MKRAVEPYAFALSKLEIDHFVAESNLCARASDAANHCFFQFAALPSHADFKTAASAQSAELLPSAQASGKAGNR